MKLTGLVGNLKYIIPNRYYLYDNFEGDIARNQELTGITFDYYMNDIIIAMRLNPVWSYPTNYYKMEHGVLKIFDWNAAHRTMYTRSQYDVGTWIYRIKFVGVIYLNTLQISFIYSDDNNRYYLRYSSGGVIRLSKRQSGAITHLIFTEFTFSADTWYLIKVTRDINGNFELFIDDDSKGTVQDDFLPEQKYFFIDNEQVQEVWVDYLKII